MSRQIKLRGGGIILLSLLLSPTISADQKEGVTHYRVKPGDTLWEITEAYRGAPEEWYVVGDANQIRNPRHLQPGDLLALPPLPKLEAEVEHLEGSAWRYDAAGNRVALTQDMALTAGDKLETGSNAFVALSLPHGESVVIPSRSVISIEKQDRNNSLLRIQRGELEARVPPQRDNREVLNIDTPNGIVGVRGTHFRVSQAEDGTRTTTLEGEVELDQGSMSTSIPAGRGALANSRATVQDRALLSAPAINSERLRVSQPLKITLDEVPGASAYRVQLARDPLFRTIFRDKRSPSNTVSFDSIPGGFYYVRASAFDDLSLEGHYDRELITHHPIQVNVLESKQQHTFRWTPVSSLQYRLTLSENASFNAPFMTQTFTDSEGVTLNQIPVEHFYWRLEVFPKESSSSSGIIVATGSQGAQG